MKKFTKLAMLITLVIALCIGLPAWALVSGAMSGSASGTTDARLIMPADSNAHTVALAINATSDKAASKLRVFWDSDGVTTTVDQASTGTTLYVASTTGFDANDIIAIQTPGGGVIQRTVSAVSAGASLTLSAALATGYGSVNDRVTKLGDSATDSDADWPVGAATVEKSNAVGVIIGPRNSPVLLVLDGTSACSINYATWDFK